MCVPAEEDKVEAASGRFLPPPRIPNNRRHTIDLHQHPGRFQRHLSGQRPSGKKNPAHRGRDRTAEAFQQGRFPCAIRSGPGLLTADAEFTHDDKKRMELFVLGFYRVVPAGCRKNFGD